MLVIGEQMCYACSQRRKTSEAQMELKDRFFVSQLTVTISTAPRFEPSCVAADGLSAGEQLFKPPVCG